MGLFSRAREMFLGRKRAALRAARRAEALGRLDEATASYLDAEAPEEAARLFALRAESAPDPSARYLLLGQAAAHAAGASKTELEKRRARLAVELVRTEELRMTKLELGELARELARLDEPSLAAEIYARLGDSDAQARMLVEAGAIERLESVLNEEQQRERRLREEQERQERIRDMARSGQRRRALAEGQALREPDPALADLLKRIAETQVKAPRAVLEIEGRKLQVVFGDEVTLGRSGATLVFPSPAISREHLALRRSGGQIQAVDLDSRNGTLLRGVRLDAALPVADRVELSLGGEVPVVLAPSPDGGVGIESGSEAWVAPLGPLVVGKWRIAPGPDGWLELETEAPVCLGALRAQGGIQLCTGDELSVELGGPVVLRIVE